MNRQQANTGTSPADLVDAWFTRFLCKLFAKPVPHHSTVAEHGVQETPLPNRFQANEVFSSQDIEDKVSLQAVLCKCSILLSDSQHQGKLSSHCYTCGFDYDSNAVHLSMTMAL